jgi:rod shape-determining protein MreD
MIQTRHGTLVVIFSFIFAIVLTVLPLPTWLNVIRPQFVTLTMFYWAIALPHRYGIVSAFILGLALDVIAGNVLGLNALLLSFVAYLGVTQYSRLRMFTRLMQAGAVLLIVALTLLLKLWIENAMQIQVRAASYWIPAITSAAFWFVWFPILRGLRRKFSVS